MLSLLGINAGARGNMSLMMQNIIALSVLVSTLSILGFYFFTKSPITPSYQREVFPKILMRPTDSTFWDEKANLRGLTGHFGLSDQVCSNFFGIWPSDCTEKFAELDQRINVISAQMKQMNATFTLYTTGIDSCNFPYTGIEVAVFNTSEILSSYGFEAVSDKMSTWKKTRYTRISDVLRIALAHRFQKSYLDTDMHFLHLRKEIYQRAYAVSEHIKIT